MIEKIIEKAKQSNKKVYIYAHKFPDADATSSSLALAEYLKSFGIDAKYVVSSQTEASNKLIGEIPSTDSVEPNSISIILDTSTFAYTENKNFQSSSPENIYIIDHHGKNENTKCIEESLGIPSENVIRNPNSSSACEILLNEFDQSKINKTIATLLTLGLYSDTAKLQFIKPSTIDNLIKLLKLGADYKNVVALCSEKLNLKAEVGIAKALLKAQKFAIGNTFGLILSLDNQEVNSLSTNFFIRSPQKKIFKMNNIENCSFTCMFAENEPKKFDTEFRSSSIYGNFDVLKLATMHNGGGHHNAAGCLIEAAPLQTKENIEDKFKLEALELYSDTTPQISNVEPNKQDQELAQIMETTKRFTTKTSLELFEKVNELIKAGANYSYVFKKFKSFEKFMLQNEILSRIPFGIFEQQKPVVYLNIAPQDFDDLIKKYSITYEDILSSIDVFSDIDVASATISLPSGKKSSIDSNGVIKMSDITSKGKDVGAIGAIGEVDEWHTK